jgi:type IV pilus assembly protein PilY1
MRRGGRFLYAMDVTDPATPKIMWKISNTSSTAFAELGQTWSEPKVAKIKGYPNYVLIISAGYDAAANDVAPQGTATMGRGVYVIDAITGAPLWYAGANTTVAGLIAGSATVSTMKYAIPGDASPIDSDGDGYVDRFYLADTGGNIWRANVSALNADGTTNFASWTMSKLAALGLDSGAECATSTTPCRKFLFGPDVVQYDSLTDSVLVGSGDREQPFEVATQNRFFMVKDSHALTATPGSTIVAGGLYDATADLVQVGSAAQQTAAKASLTSSSGWYVNLGVTASNPTGSAGEKVVTKAVTVNGVTVFGTNVPDPQISGAGGNTCSAGLGEARLWSLNFKDASSLTDSNVDGLLTASDRFSVRAGGGLPPSPIAITVKINDKIYEGVGSGATIIKVPNSTIGVRSLVFWNMVTE